MKQGDGHDTFRDFETFPKLMIHLESSLCFTKKTPPCHRFLENEGGVFLRLDFPVTSQSGIGQNLDFEGGSS